MHHVCEIFGQADIYILNSIFGDMVSHNVNQFRDRATNHIYMVYFIMKQSKCLVDKYIECRSFFSFYL